ncbi:MAG: putative secreted protein with C-terminal beta-propeller domain [Bradymonadia bacterium]|jgi:uncharacterized secreted protein with C-terminal beta-propeller domain
MPYQKFDSLRCFKRASVLAATGVIALAGCGDDPAAEPGTETYTASLSAFSSCDALDEYIVDLTTDVIVDNYVYGYGGYEVDMRNDMGMEDGAAEPSAPTSGGGTGGDSGPGEFTETNNQEAGVDEPDLVKTDGETMYVVSGDTLHIIDSFPVEEAHELSTFALPSYGDQMFLAGDRVVVFSHIYTGRDSSYDDEESRPEPTPDVEPPEESGEPIEEPTPDPLDDGTWFGGTRVTVIDVSDPSAPTEAAVFDIEGNFVSARMVDGKIYLVSNSSLFNLYDPALEEAASEFVIPELDYDATPAEREAAAATLRTQVRPILVEYVADRGRDQLIPDIRTTDSDRANLFDCGELMEPGARAGIGVLSVVAFDPASPTPEGVGLLADGWQVYGSQDSLYIAQDSRWWYFSGPDTAETTSHIHKFALNSGSPVYQASGEVAGWLLNQFSMSEFDGHLRVATTDESDFGRWGGGGDISVGDSVSVDVGVSEPSTTPSVPDEAPEPDDGSGDGGSGDGGSGDDGSGDGGSDDDRDSGEKDLLDLREDPTVQANNVFVLEQDGSALSVVGGIRGIAPTEQIFAVRFVGETGYVVTFRQTDPLFTIDLSDPTAPVVRGELHIPGYSGYLHPYGEDRLIGIGRDGTEEGQVLGTQISLFDVSDLDAPARVATYTLPYGEGNYSWSEAEHDHHAFTFYESHNLLAIPVTLEDYGWEDDSYSHFSGIVVFEVEGDSISEYGRVSHTFMAHDSYCGDADETDPEPVEACSSWDYPWWVNMRRSVFIDDALFAISDMGVTASDLSALDEPMAEIRF